MKINESGYMNLTIGSLLLILPERYQFLQTNWLLILINIKNMKKSHEPKSYNPKSLFILFTLKQAVKRKNEMPSVQGSWN